MNFAYIRDNLLSEQTLSLELSRFSKRLGLEIDQLILDSNTEAKSWEQTKLPRSVLNVMQPGDHLLVYDATNLGKSLAQLLQLFQRFAAQKVTVWFTKYNLCFEGKTEIDSAKLLKLLKAIEEDFLAKRSTVAMKIRRESGLAVGRPVGKHNQSLKLDIFRHDIENFLAHGISKVVIAKRIGCHAQTLYNYIEKRQLDVKRAIA